MICCAQVAAPPLGGQSDEAAITLDPTLAELRFQRR
jgi:hypothetical protein